MKNNRTYSFIYVILVYLLATVCGILAYVYIPINALWLKLLVADVIATVVTFAFSVAVSNASVYDPYWSVQPIVIAVCFAIGVKMTAIRILLLIAVCVWGVRLTANWAYTFNNLNHQDWRYTMLKEKTKKFYPVINFLGIHLFPTIVVYACVLPLVYAFKVVDLTLNAGSAIFFTVCILAVTLQGTADMQMHAFRKNKTTSFIRTGLWKYSRHPNYLGEILMWWGIALMVLCADIHLWYLLGGALLNTVMFLVVSIPMADKRQSKKQGFSEYKAQTRMLLPIKK